MIPFEIEQGIRFHLSLAKKELLEVNEILAQEAPGEREMVNRLEVAKRWIDKAEAELLVILEVERCKSQN